MNYDYLIYNQLLLLSLSVFYLSFLLPLVSRLTAVAAQILHLLHIPGFKSNIFPIQIFPTAH